MPADVLLPMHSAIGTVYAVEDRTVTLDVGGGTKIRILKGNVAGQWKAVEAQPTST